MKQIYFGILQLMSMCMILLLSVAAAFGQGRTITGKVTDARNGSGVASAGIVVRGTGAVSGADGTFSISVPRGTQSLTISSVGFGTQDVPLGTSDNVTVPLQFASTATLDEVENIDKDRRQTQPETKPGILSHSCVFFVPYVSIKAPRFGAVTYLKKQ